jgi:uncharacterized membrane protein
MRDHRDLTAASTTAVLCAAIAFVIPLEVLRMAAAVPLSLFLPGYAITAAIFARFPLGKQDLLLLSIALSLATLVIGSLVLTVAPGGLKTGSWAALLLVITLGGCFVAARRRRHLGPAGPYKWARRVRPVDAALLVGTVAVAGAAVAVAWTPFPAKDVVGHTRLWVLPLDDGTAAGVRVGVGSDEEDITTYRLELRVGRERAFIPSDIELAPGQERVLKVRVERPPSGTLLPVTATLYRLDSPGLPYRRVRSWIPGA